MTCPTRCSTPLPPIHPALVVAGLLLGAAASHAGPTEVPAGCCAKGTACSSPVTRSECVDIVGGTFYQDRICGETKECVTTQKAAGSMTVVVEIDDPEGEDPPRTAPAAGSGTIILRPPGDAGDGANIPIEIIELELSGSSPSSGDVEIEEQDDRDSSGSSDLESGESSLDVWLELKLPDLLGSVRARTSEPVALRSSGVHSFPPVGAVFDGPPGDTPLVATGDPATEIGRIRNVRLTFDELQPAPVDCRLRSVPAAGLLVPYFETDVEDSSGVTTLIAVTNTSDRFVLSRIVLWTDLGVPTLTFYVYLSPFDVQTINLRDVFAGRLPDTSAVLFDLERPTTNFDPCTPEELAPSLSEADRQSLLADHAGLENPETGLCAARPSQGADTATVATRSPFRPGNSGVVRGHATIDTVRRCDVSPTVRSYERADALLNPFGLTRQNALMGDVFYVDPGENFAQSETLPSLPAQPLLFEPGDYTFYGRFDRFGAIDARTPLPSRYMVRYLHGGPFDGGTRLIVWRDPRHADVQPFPCGTLPEWFPLGEAEVVFFDEEENRVQVDRLDAVCPGAGGVSFACDLTGAPFPFGFLSVDLDHGDGTPAQAYLATVARARGRFSVGHAATALDDNCGVRPAALDSATGGSSGPGSE